MLRYQPFVISHKIWKPLEAQGPEDETGRRTWSSCLNEVHARRICTDSIGDCAHMQAWHSNNVLVLLRAFMIMCFLYLLCNCIFIVSTCFLHFPTSNMHIQAWANGSIGKSAMFFSLSNLCLFSPCVHCVLPFHAFLLFWSFACSPLYASLCPVEGNTYQHRGLLEAGYHEKEEYINFKTLLTAPAEDHASAGSSFPVHSFTPLAAWMSFNGDQKTGKHETLYTNM